MRHETSPDRITVLEVGAEGGGVTLHAERTERLQWRFCVDKHESLFEELLDEAAGSFHRESEWTTSWEHVLSLLNAYPWTRLRPTEVHPIFADAVASAYEARTGDSLSQNREWLEVLERAGWRAPERRECIAYSRRMDRALVLASVAHSSADRKGTSIPYVSHPVHVARLLERHGFDENVVIAGLLHDVVEDLDAEDEAVRARFRSVFPELSAASDDLLLHGLAGGRRIVIAVEGKADEPLGSTIEQELKKSGRTRTTGSSSGIPDRIRELSNKMFGRAPNGDLFGLRYQLLHGIAGMVIEADKSKAEVGVFLIHVFETDSCDERRLRRNDEDLRAFMNALGCPDPATGQLAEFNVPNGGGKYFIGKAVTTQSTITRSHAERGEANADALSRIGGTS
jgi:hypothetical protein